MNNIVGKRLKSNFSRLTKFCCVRYATNERKGKRFKMPSSYTCSCLIIIGVYGAVMTWIIQ